MKIQKEHAFVIIFGLFIVSYLLESIVTPLKIKLPTPYSYLSPAVFTKYPFTTAVVIIRAISLFLAPLFVLSFIPNRHFMKVGILFAIGLLAQLYSLQQLISGTTLIPLEWAISLSIAGALLIIPTIMIALKGVFIAAKEKINMGKITFEDVDSSN
jgi:hypothetical protein